MLPPPIGYVHLYQAVDAVGRRVRGPDWLPICCQDWLRYLTYANLVDDIIRTVAEACEAGKLAAAFQHEFKGADILDRDVWQKPHWRNFFASGTTIVDRPRLVNFEPDPSGTTTPCERKIFVRRDSLDRFMLELAPFAAEHEETTENRPSRGPKAGISARVEGEMRRDLIAGKTTAERLRSETEKVLEGRYRASRDTVRKARKTVLSKPVETLK